MSTQQQIPFYDSYGREVKQGDEALYAGNAGTVSRFDRGGKRVYLKWPDGKETSISEGAMRNNHPNTLLSLTAQKENRSSLYFPNKTEFTGKEEIADAFLHLMQEKGSLHYNPSGGDEKTAIMALLPDDPQATVDKVIKIYEDSRDNGNGTYRVVDQATFDKNFADKVKAEIKAKGAVQNQDKGSSFSIGKAAVALGAVVVGLFVGNSKKPEGIEDQVGEDGKSRPKPNWFRRNLGLSTKILAFGVALDFGIAAFKPDYKPVIGRFTDMVTNTVKGVGAGKSAS